MGLTCKSQTFFFPAAYSACLTFKHLAPPQKIFAISSSERVPALGPGAKPSCPTVTQAGLGLGQAASVSDTVILLLTVAELIG